MDIPLFLLLLVILIAVLELHNALEQGIWLGTWSCLSGEGFQDGRLASEREGNSQDVKAKQRAKVKPIVQDNKTGGVGPVV